MSHGIPHYKKPEDDFAEEEDAQFDFCLRDMVCRLTRPGASVKLLKRVKSAGSIMDWVNEKGIFEVSEPGHCSRGKNTRCPAAGGVRW